MQHILSPLPEGPALLQAAVPGTQEGHCSGARALGKGQAAAGHGSRAQARASVEVECQHFAFWVPGSVCVAEGLGWGAGGGYLPAVRPWAEIQLRHHSFIHSLNKHVSRAFSELDSGNKD